MRRDIFKGGSILHAAVYFNAYKMLKYFLDKGISPDDLDIEGSSPLHYAVVKNDEKSIDILLKYRPNINSSDNEGVRPLHLLIENNTSFALFEKFIKAGADIHCTDIFGNTPLHVASDNGFDQIVSYLLKHEVNVSPDTLDGATPLHMACEEGRSSVVSILLEEKKLLRYHCFYLGLAFS